MEYRIRHAMNDQRREHWTRCVWGAEASDNSNYDLIINLDQLSAPLAVSLISRVIGEETFQEDEEDRQQFEDNILVSRIFTELNKNKPTRQAQIYVTSKNGHVSITGDVGSHKIKDAISYIAHNVQGVK
jgi:osmotically-inducible protein OsmY